MKLLLHSVSYSGSWGQAFLTLDQFAGKAAELGFDGVMLGAKRPHLSLLDYGEKERAALRTKLEQLGLHNNCVAGYNNITGDLEHGEIPHRELQVHYLVELARLTKDVGATLLRVFTGYENPAAAYTPQWRLIVEVLRETSKRASDLGVTIGVQNHHDIGVGFESLHDLILEIAEPNCKALFDAWAPALHKADLKASAKLLAPHMAHTTIADYQLRPRYRYNPAVVNYEAALPLAQAVPMGKGFIDYKSFLSELSNNGFDGTVAYEMCSPLLGGGSIENLDRYARTFLDYMKSN